MSEQLQVVPTCFSVCNVVLAVQVFWLFHFVVVCCNLFQSFETVLSFLFGLGCLSVLFRCVGLFWAVL